MTALPIPPPNLPRLTRRPTGTIGTASYVWSGARPSPTAVTWTRYVWSIVAGALVVGVLPGLGLSISPVVVAALVVVWPISVGHLAGDGAARLGASRSRAALDVLRSGGLIAIGCWLVHPLAGEATSAANVLPLLILLTAGGLFVAATLPLTRPVRVVLTGAVRDTAAATLELASSSRYDVVAVEAPHGSAEGPGQGPHIKITDDSVIEAARRHHADAVIVLPSPEMSSAQIRRLSWYAGSVGLPVYIGTGLLDVAASRLRPTRVAGMNLVHVRPAALGGGRRVIKELIERPLALLGLLALAPLLLLVSIAVRFDSSGPALFRQRRIGRHGVPFTMYKFRTMRETAEDQRGDLVAVNESDGVLFKMRLDPRVTGLGRRLRRYSLDEVPQLLNVVCGHMSLVGPRPALPDEVARYELDPRRRLAVKPGLTGLWQVSGRSDLSWAESVRLDLAYVDNWSLGLDAKILGQTARAVLGHRGAY